MNPTIIIAVAALLALPVVPFLARAYRRAGLTGAVNIAEGTHLNSDTRFAEEAIATKYLLVKKGTAELGILINGVNDRPCGVCTDSPASGDEGDVTFFGARNETLLVVPAANIAVNTEVYTAAGGKVSAEPTVAGTYYRVGVTKRDLIQDTPGEIDPCEPEPLVVIAALGSVNGAIGTLNSTAVNPTKVDFDALLVQAELLADDLRAVVAALATGKKVKIAS